MAALSKRRLSKPCVQVARHLTPEFPMSNTQIEPIGQLRAGALGAAAVGEQIHALVRAAGPTQVSMDTDGSVYAMPATHPFSKAMVRQYSDRIVGTYSDGITADDITGDLVAQWKGDREARA